MAKDGTNRGGARLGAGRKPKETKVLSLNGQEAKLQAVEAPKIKQYLSAKQKNGKLLGAKRIYTEMYDYIAALGFIDEVPGALIEEYAICSARWIQCEEAITEYGFLSKHPTTEGVIATPFSGLSNQYMKQANQALYMINQILNECRQREESRGSGGNDLLKMLQEKRAQ